MTALNGPVLFNTSTGSDSAASGVGPSTAISGTNASLNATSTVTVAGADLSGVSAGDLFWVDTTSGRQFSPIASVDDGADTVTCDDAFSVTESSRNYGIGGKRNSFDNANSAKMWEADWKPGWIVETETDQNITGTLDVQVGGSVTGGGYVTMRGDTEHRTISINTNAFNLQIHNVPYVRIRNLKFVQTHATKVTCIYVQGSSSNYVRFERCIVGDPTNKVGYGFSIEAAITIFEDVEVQWCSSGVGIYTNSAIREIRASSVHVHDCDLAGINTGGGSVIFKCTVADNGGDGIILISTTTTGFAACLHESTIDGNTGDGIELSGGPALGHDIKNNQLTNNGGYGIRAASGQDNPGMDAGIDFNNYYNNTSGARLNVTDHGNNQAVDPSYTDSANEDYSIGDTVSKAGGFPDSSRTIGSNQSATTSYVDIGAAQRQEGGGGVSSILGGGSLSGGFA